MSRELPDSVKDSSTGLRISVVGSLREYGKTVFVTLLVALMIKTFVVEAFRIPSGSMENTLQVGDFLLVNKLAYGIRGPRHVPLTNLAIPSITIPFLGGVRRGDVVVFEFPDMRTPTPEELRDVNYIKRCIGLPGDTVEIKQSRVFVNGREMLFSRDVKVGGEGGYAGWERGVHLLPGGRGYSENDYGPIVVPKLGEVVPLTRETLDQWREFVQREGHTLGKGADGSILLDGTAADSYTVESDYYFMLGDNRNNSLDSRFWGFVPGENLVGEALLVYWSWNPEIPLTHLWDKLGSIRWERFGKLVR